MQVCSSLKWCPAAIRQHRVSTDGMSCRSSAFIRSCDAEVSGSHEEISQALEGHWHPAWNETSLHSRNPV